MLGTAIYRKALESTSPVASIALVCSHCTAVVADVYMAAIDHVTNAAYRTHNRRDLIALSKVLLTVGLLRDTATHKHAIGAQVWGYREYYGTFQWATVFRLR